MKRTKNKRPLTVKDRIARAFIRLLKKREYNEITVVDIITEAQAGRVSFYRNFNEKDDVLRYYITSVTDDWLSRTEENYLTLTKESLSPYIVWLFEHMYEHRDFTDILMKTDKLYLLEEEFDKRLFARLSDTASPWKIVYKIGGVYKLFVYWAKNGYKERNSFPFNSSGACHFYDFFLFILQRRLFAFVHCAASVPPGAIRGAQESLYADRQQNSECAAFVLFRADFASGVMHRDGLLQPHAHDRSEKR